MRALLILIFSAATCLADVTWRQLPPVTPDRIYGILERDQELYFLTKRGAYKTSDLENFETLVDTPHYGGEDIRRSLPAGFFAWQRTTNYTASTSTDLVNWENLPDQIRDMAYGADVYVGVHDGVARFGKSPDDLQPAAFPFAGAVGNVLFHNGRFYAYGYNRKESASSHNGKDWTFAESNIETFRKMETAGGLILSGGKYSRDGVIFHRIPVPRDAYPYIPPVYLPESGLWCIHTQETNTEVLIAGDIEGPWESSVTGASFQPVAMGTFQGQFIVGGVNGQILVGSPGRVTPPDPPELSIAICFRLEWESSPGVQYSIVGSNDLKTWHHVRTVTGTGGTISEVVDQQFRNYRVEQR